MSEYQYYEFQTVDRPLTAQQMEELRALSTRAEITPTSFTNLYHYGDCRGDPHQLMERYFDAFVYIANWGTRWLMFRLPRRLLDVKTASLCGTATSATSCRTRTIKLTCRGRCRAYMPRETRMRPRSS